ncbi:hypothetical protein QBC45DRAFT_214007 [Copromyces sp. CBS 386.78]|nr:hypothetical protein QBC45DRAFT_214007 [Copromyces sp. CBS 386.78]
MATASLARLWSIARTYNLTLVCLLVWYKKRQFPLSRHWKWKSIGFWSGWVLLGPAFLYFLVPKGLKSRRKVDGEKHKRLLWRF